ncbi:MAG: fatty acid hydroxylase family protein [Rhodocyclaceae bacterium]|nr:fatty acid hydroxylase family protein [Rhodocyclaceae bacterium]MCA3135214.1 fatty acid hydroxylase family protein [Rhodocyclaceae bacterium]MCA3145246.1 fatty acid hydroxylase family protein [Rhodocyclaceae bacterium]
MMSERQRRFREEYKAQISPWYHGLVHVGVMYAVGITVIGWCLWRMDNPSWEWLLVVPVFFVSNLFEWWIHKYVMHRLIDVWALRAIYDRHTRQHHQYFTSNEMTVDSTREFRIIFFPWRALATFISFGVPFALTLGWLVNANAGYVLMVTIVGQYLLYETFHYCCHVHENWFVRHAPFVNTIRRHHTAHHNQGIMMERNMNLTFPIADWLMGTSDLDRGLLGHIFNGYSTRHVRPELRELDKRHTARNPSMERQPA